MTADRRDRSRPEHPWVVQIVFAVLVVLDVLLRAAVGMLTGVSIAGLLVLALATVAAVVLPWKRVPRPAFGMLPVVDIAVLGLTCQDPAGAGLGVLLVLPALYLGRHFGWTGSAVTALAGTVLIVVPCIVVSGGAAGVVEGAVLAVVVATTVSGAAAGASASIRDRHHLDGLVADSLGVGLSVLGPEGELLFINDIQRAQLGPAAAEPLLTEPAAWRRHGHRVTSQPTPAVVFGVDADAPLPVSRWPWERVRAGEEFEDQRVWVGADPEHRRALSVSARAILGPDQSRTAVAVTSHDITDLIRALQVKHQFVAEVSHELRTPLTSINGYGLLLLDRDDLAVDVRDQLGVITRNAARLQRLVDDLLASTESVTGVDLPRRPCDLAALAQHCVDSAEPRAAASRIDLGLDAAEAVEVSVDPQRLSQVLDNLIGNALKFAPAGGVVRVGVADLGAQARLTVEDSGPGIAAADLDRVFQRFYRAEHCREAALPGLGLGLSIAADVVAAHGGTIRADRSRLGGARLEVLLPRLDQPQCSS